MEQAGLLRLARSISVSSGSVAALSMETSGVQVPVFEMLLAPVKAGLAMPMMTLAFLGLDDRIRNKECLNVIIDKLLYFGVSSGRESILASKGFELIYRVCMSCQAMGGGRLEDMLEHLREYSDRKINDQYFFFVPRSIDQDDPDAKAAIAWHFRIAALALSTLCNRHSDRIHVERIVERLFPDNPQFSVMISAMAYWSLEDSYDIPPLPECLRSKCDLAEQKALESGHQPSTDVGLLDVQRFRDEVRDSLEREEVEVGDDLVNAAEDWAWERNDRIRLMDARVQLVQGWEQLLEVCFQKASESAPRLLGRQHGALGFQVCKDVLSLVADKLVCHPNAEVGNFKLECLRSVFG